MLLLCFCSCVCHAAIYMQLDKNGNTVYSDTPLNANAKKIDLPKTEDNQTHQDQVAPASAASLNEETENPANQIPTLKSSPHVYTTFLMESPKDQETFQNQPVIPVEIKIDPLLQAGDKIQLYLDGKPMGSPVPTTHLQLMQIDRGSHQLSAVLIDNNQQKIKDTGTITIFVHQASVSSINRVNKSPGGM